MGGRFMPVHACIHAHKARRLRSSKSLHPQPTLSCLQHPNPTHAHTHTYAGAHTRTYAGTHTHTQAHTRTRAHTHRHRHAYSHLQVLIQLPEPPPIGRLISVVELLEERRGPLIEQGWEVAVHLRHAPGGGREGAGGADRNGGVLCQRPSGLILFGMN